MSGHSKWANIKHKKSAADAKRGAIFTKLIREITVAARQGGEDLNSNARLRTAVNKARESNMPSDNIERAIKKGTGGLEGVTYEEIRYEGYGPSGVAIMLDAMTDNKNRTTPEIRAIFSKNGGNLGETGCVSYNFDYKGQIVLAPGVATEDDVMELLLDYNVDDITTEDDNSIQVVTSPDAFNEICDVLKKKYKELSYNEITYIPKSTITLDEKAGARCLRLIETLEDHDDVQHVYSNEDIPDEVMQAIGDQK